MRFEPGIFGLQADLPAHLSKFSYLTQSNPKLLKIILSSGVAVSNADYLERKGEETFLKVVPFTLQTYALRVKLNVSFIE